MNIHSEIGLFIDVDCLGTATSLLTNVANSISGHTSRVPTWQSSIDDRPPMPFLGWCIPMVLALHFVIRIDSKFATLKIAAVRNSFGTSLWFVDCCWLLKSLSCCSFLLLTQTRYHAQTCFFRRIQQIVPEKISN